MNFPPYPIIDLEQWFSPGDHFAPFSSPLQETFGDIWRKFGFHT